VAAGLNPMDLRRGINAARDAVIEAVQKSTRLITDKETMIQVATISANGDKELGALIGGAIHDVGKDGVVTVQDGKTLRDELELIEGRNAKFSNGWLSPYFITDKKTQKTEFNDAAVLIYDKKLSNIQAVLPLLEECYQQKTPLLIIAEDIEAELLTTLVVNRLRVNLPVCAVKAPGFGENRTQIMRDLAVLTGCEVISEEAGVKLEELTFDKLGKAHRVTVTKDNTILVGGGGTGDAIEGRVEMIRSAIAQSTSSYEKTQFQERLARLTGGAAVVKVGGATETEVSEKKDRIDDALNATQAAVREGIVPGGGMALLYASQVLDSLKVQNDDQRVGVRIVKRAVQEPARQIFKNAGMESSILVGRLLEAAKGDPLCQLGIPNLDSTGYDVPLKNMFDAGVIDPALVVRTALTDACSVSSLLVTAEAVIVDAVPNTVPKSE